jgi:hypothetical protein
MKEKGVPTGTGNDGNTSQLEEVITLITVLSKTERIEILKCLIQPMEQTELSEILKVIANHLANRAFNLAMNSNVDFSQSSQPTKAEGLVFNRVALSS